MKTTNSFKLLLLFLGLIGTAELNAFDTAEAEAIEKICKEQTSSSPQKRALNKQDMIELIPSIVLFPASVSLVAHEFGHALVAKVLAGDPIDIHLGPKTDDIKQDYLYKNNNITIHSFTIGGFAMAQPTRAVIAAGPIFGVASSLLMKKAINNIMPKQSLIGIMLKSVCNSTAAFQAIYGFTPCLAQDGDGYRLWASLGIPKNQLDKCLPITGTVLVAAMLGFIIKGEFECLKQIDASFK